MRSSDIQNKAHNQIAPASHSCCDSRSWPSPRSDSPTRQLSTASCFEDSSLRSEYSYYLANVVLREGAAPVGRVRSLQIPHTREDHRALAASCAWSRWSPPSRPSPFLERPAAAAGCCTPPPRPTCNTLAAARATIRGRGRSPPLSRTGPTGKARSKPPSRLECFVCWFQSGCQQCRQRRRSWEYYVKTVVKI